MRIFPYPIVDLQGYRSARLHIAYGFQLKEGEFFIGNIQERNGKSRSWTRALNAMSDELIIWKRALGSEEVSDLFLVGNPNHMPPIASYD